MNSIKVIENELVMLLAKEFLAVMITMTTVVHRRPKIWPENINTESLAFNICYVIILIITFHCYRHESTKENSCKYNINWYQWTRYPSCFYYRG